MKKIILLAAVTSVFFTACQKEKVTAARPASKYACTCTVTLSYIDHCGDESNSDTSYIYAYQREDAVQNCKKLSSHAADTYTITDRQCVLQ